jgi:hypothetical protein
MTLIEISGTKVEHVKEEIYELETNNKIKIVRD